MNRLWKLFLCGFLSSSAFAPLFWTPALILGFTVLSAYLRECSTKKNAFFTGYVFSFGQFLSGLYWIAASLWVDIEHFWPWILPCVVIFPAYLAFYGGGVALLLHHVGQRMTPFYHLFFLGFFWIIAEQLRTYLFINFPWNLTSYSLGACAAFMQGAALIGPFGLGIVIFLMAALLETYSLWFHRSVSTRVLSVTTTAILYLLYQWGDHRYQQSSPPPSEAFSLRIVQPNIEQTIKWDPALFRKNLERYVHLSNDNRPSFIQCIIWPETVLVDFQLYEEWNYKKIQSAIPAGGFLILGAQRLEHFPTKTLKNSLLILNENLNVKHFYDKNYLVLFGEYIPFRKTLERFGISIADLSQSILDITAGNEHKAIQCDKIPPFNPLICYEAIFPHFIIQEKPAPCWIINLTNDAWFGNTAGPYQHLTICRFRAIEQGVPIIRVANTGISAVIDYKGKILHSLPLNQGGYIDVTVPNKAPSVPPYTIYGENIFYILILAFLIISAFLNRKYVKNLIYSRGF